MRNLNTMLREADAALLPILAARWGLQAAKATHDEFIALLSEAMLEPARAEKVYDSLDDKQRGALQTLNGFKGRAMPAIMFEKMFGEIRLMGAGRIEREKPHENPVSIAEVLYYRGLIGKGNDKVGGGIGPIIYIPEDVAAVLPTHKTGYSADVLEKLEKTSSTDFAANPTEVQVLPMEEVENVVQADTSIVDDMTTLLAYLQLHAPIIDPTFALEDAVAEDLQQHLLVKDQRRAPFLIGIGITAELIEVQSGKIFPRRAEVRRWLGEKRAAQLKWLAEAWLKSTDYLELWHIPGLYPESGWSYDAALARQTMLEIAKQLIPKNEWWALDDFIDAVKATNPNFQRPGGDFESWYIRGDDGEYLHGLSSWDAIEGAVLSFYFVFPMHWLALTDLADDAVRLTAYGRAFIEGNTPWPTPADPEDKVEVRPDGTLVASRKVQRIDRFQLARFTMWMQGATLKGDPYIYKLDATGIQRASEQGITTEHIATFIKRMLDGTPIPSTIVKLLENWRSGPAASVSLEQLLVLRTTAPETLDFIYNEPALRRYLGARLGPMAVIVRGDQWEALRDALGSRGIEVEILG